VLRASFGEKGEGEKFRHRGELFASCSGKPFFSGAGRVCGALFTIFGMIRRTDF